jgi:hypothetical protein
MAPQNPVFGAKTRRPAKTGGFGKTVIFARFSTFSQFGAFLVISKNDQK